MSAARALTAADLVGSWKLRAWTSEDEQGLGHPMGSDAEGILVYTTEGTMITTIGRARRPPIEGGELSGGGPTDQRLDAMSSFIAYSGTFRVEGDDVVHEVTMSLFPNWIGTIQRRHVQLRNGRELSLSVDPLVVAGRRSSHRLIWERVRA